MEVLGTPLCLKDTSFENNSPFLWYACDQQMEELSTPLRLKIKDGLSQKQYLFDKSNHQRSNLFIACACD